MQNIVERLLNGDRRALARMVTLIESETPQVRRYLAELHQHGGRAHIVGVTGAPGAGKGGRPAWGAAAYSERQRFGIHRWGLARVAAPGRDRGDPGGAGKALAKWLLRVV